jgi:hypothetical protein
VRGQTTGQPRVTWAQGVRDASGRVRPGAGASAELQVERYSRVPLECSSSTRLSTRRVPLEDLDDSADTEPQVEERASGRQCARQVRTHAHRHPGTVHANSRDCNIGASEPCNPQSRGRCGRCSVLAPAGLFGREGQSELQVRGQSEAEQIASKSTRCNSAMW